MKNYLKLVHFEFNRFFKIYISLIGITMIVQLLGSYVVPKKYLDHAQEMMVNQSLTASQYVEQWGGISMFDLTQSVWFMGPIALCIVAIFFYIFLIWYRDWFGKNTFIYRLLTLPTNRLNLYLSKATTILMMTLGLTALQLMILPISRRIFEGTVPADFIFSLSLQEIVGSFNYLTIFFPNSVIDFTIHYGLGLLAVFIIFTAILLERSYGSRGIILGVLYCVCALGILLLPVIITAMREKLFLYPIEYFFLEVFLSLGILVLSIWLSHFLLKKKITV